MKQLIIAILCIASGTQASQPLVSEKQAINGVEEERVLAALRNDDPELLRDCFASEKLSSIAETTVNGHNLIHLALELGSPRCVQALLELGIKKTLKIAKEIDAHLEHAETSQDLDKILPWYACVARIHMKTPLELAATYQSWNIMDTLLNRGANITTETLVALQKWLIKAISERDNDIFRKLIGLGASLKHDGAKTTTALLIKRAIQQGDITCVQMALEAKADVTKDAYLYTACEYGRADIVRLLLAAGANPNAQVAVTPNGYITALGIAYTKGHMDCFDILLEAGANPSTLYEGRDGYHPLPPWKRAIQNKDTAMVQKLLAAGANPNIYFMADNRDIILAITALNYALSLGSEEIARLLIDHGAHIEAPSKGSDINSELVAFSPLHTAVVHNMCSIVELLLQKGVSVRSCSSEASLLFSAASNGCARCVAALLAHGAQPCTGAYENAASRDDIAMHTELEAALCSLSVPCTELLMKAKEGIPSVQGEEDLHFKRAMEVVFGSLRDNEWDVGEREVVDIPVMLKYLIKNCYRFCRQSTICTRIAHKRIVQLLTLFRPIDIPLLVIEEIFMQSPEICDHAVTMFLASANRPQLGALFNTLNSLRPEGTYAYDMQSVLSAAKPLALEYLFTRVIDTAQKIVEEDDPKAIKNFFRTDEGTEEIRRLIAEGLDEAQDRYIQEYRDYETAHSEQHEVFQNSADQDDDRDDLLEHHDKKARKTR